MAAWFTRGRLSRMLPLLSVTRLMVPGLSSRLKTESFSSTLSSRMRKFSCLRPSAKRPRSSSTVVCNTTRLTSTRIRESCPTVADWPGGGGGALGVVGICASAPAQNSSIENANSVRKPRRAETNESSVARGVVAGLRVHVERRKPLGCAQLDFDLSPARVMCLVAWPISHYILLFQLHADFRRNVRKLVQMLDSEDATARHVRYCAQQ